MAAAMVASATVPGPRREFPIRVVSGDRSCRAALRWRGGGELAEMAPPSGAQNLQAAAGAVRPGGSYGRRREDTARPPSGTMRPGLTLAPLQPTTGPAADPL